MKKLILSALSIALVAAVMTSCKKTSKGKLSNDWKIESYETINTQTQANGDRTTTTTSYNGSTVNRRTEEFENGTSTSTTVEAGILTDPTFTIEKDGTWKSSETFTYTYTPTPGVTVTTTSLELESGTWSFIGKNKEEDFKKNERVLFNTLASSQNSTTVTKMGTVSNTEYENYSNTYKIGEYAMIYTVTESKGKTLELSTESGGTDTIGNNSESDTTIKKMKLVQK